MLQRGGVAALVLLSLQLRACLAQTCGSTDVVSAGATGGGWQDDTNAFLRVENDASAGVIFIPAGTYRIAQSIQLNKPIIAAPGAVLKVEGTLTLYNQPQHPYSLFFTGPGKVRLTTGCQFALPEWWGASGTGNTDDSTAIQSAYEAVQSTGNAMLYLKGTYGIGPATELRFAPGAVIMAEEGAQFVAFGGNSKGITLTTGNSGVKSVFPHLSGFSDFCIRLQGVSLGAIQLKSLTKCGDAIRLESTGKGMHCLDNTVWFDKILDSSVGIAFRAEVTNCQGGDCVFQGNQFTGNLIDGNADRAIQFRSLSYPAWDSNNFDVSTINPPNKDSYRVMDAVPAADREVLKIGSLGALPAAGSKVFGSGRLNQMQIAIRHAAPLQEGQFGLYGELNLVELQGELTPKLQSTPIRCTNTANSKAQFNGGKAIYGTYNTLQAVPNSDWPTGQVRQFFFYHQMANSYLYQIKCNSIKNGQGLPSIECVQYDDNNGKNGRYDGEVAIWLLNQSGGTVKAGAPAAFTIAVNTLGLPAGS